MKDSCTIYEGDFVDDIVLLSHLREDLWQDIKELESAAGQVGFANQYQKMTEKIHDKHLSKNT